MNELPRYNTRVKGEFEHRFFPVPNETHTAVLWIPLDNANMSVADFILPPRTEVSPEYIERIKAKPSTEFKHEIRPGELTDA